MSEHVVTVNEGKLRGQYRQSVTGKGYYAFKGIPFAKPPIGELRFAAPQPPEPWEGIRDATQTPSICYQAELGNAHGSEDCLYLNVFTPKLISSGDNPLPVIVFLHGGGFVHGNGVDDELRPDYLLDKDVIFVGINYRLGIFGFLSLNRKEAPGNMGLKDQVQALKWVQKNISNFNGNPNNITILGASAGASSVEYLLLSPLAKGLFHKAIAQAGSTLSPWAKNNDVKQLAYKIPQIKGVTVSNDDDLYAYLKNMPADELDQLSATVYTNEKFRGGIYFGFVPTIEQPGDWDAFLSESPYVKLKRGDFQKVPLLTGCCSREGLLMVAFNNAKLEKLNKEQNFFDYLPFNIKDVDKEDIEKKIKNAYVSSSNEFSDDFAVEFFTDIDFLGGVVIAAKYIAKKTFPVYFYNFCYDGNLNYLKNKLNIIKPGACHGDESGYFLKINSDKKVTDTDNLVRERITTMWTNFVKFGNPTPSTDGIITTKWEPMDASKVYNMRIDENLTMVQDLHPERVRVFEELYEKYFDKE